MVYNECIIIWFGGLFGNSPNVNWKIYIYPDFEKKFVIDWVIIKKTGLIMD